MLIGFTYGAVTPAIAAINTLDYIKGGASMNNPFVTVFTTAVASEQTTNQFSSSLYSLLFGFVVIAIVFAAFGKTKLGKNVFGTLRGKSRFGSASGDGETIPRGVRGGANSPGEINDDDTRGGTVIPAKYTCSLFSDGIKIASKPVHITPENPFFIGSASDDDLRVNENTVSRHHLVVAVDADGVEFVKDYGRNGDGSSNGTYYAGNFYRATSFDLPLDEKIYLGEEDGVYVVFERRKRQRGHRAEEKSGGVRISR